MKSICWAWAVALCLAILFAGGTTSKALASPPSIQVIPVDETFLAGRATQICGFTVLVHRQGTIRVITRDDQSGNPIREIDVYHVYDTFMAHGRSITGLEGGVQNITYNADGSLLVLSAGPDRWVVQPGNGPIWGATGSVLTYVSPDGQETDIRDSGPNQDFNPALCAALAP